METLTPTTVFKASNVVNRASCFFLGAGFFEVGGAVKRGAAAAIFLTSFFNSDVTGDCNAARMCIIVVDAWRYS